MLANAAGFSWVIMQPSLQNLVHNCFCHIRSTTILTIRIKCVETVTLQKYCEERKGSLRSYEIQVILTTNFVTSIRCAVGQLAVTL